MTKSGSTVRKRVDPVDPWDESLLREPADHVLEHRSRAGLDTFEPQILLQDFGQIQSSAESSHHTDYANHAVHRSSNDGFTEGGGTSNVDGKINTGSTRQLENFLPPVA